MSMGVFGVVAKKKRLVNIIAVPVCVLSYIVTLIGLFIGVHESTNDGGLEYSLMLLPINYLIILPFCR